MTDPVLRPVSRGLGPSLQHLQEIGDGSTDLGGGTQAARGMQTGMTDASSAGGLVDDTAAKYATAGIPDPLRTLINRAMDDNQDAQIM